MPGKIPKLNFFIIEQRILQNKKTVQIFYWNYSFDDYFPESETAIITAIIPITILIQAYQAGSETNVQLGIRPAIPIKATITPRTPSVIRDI